jgi:hypothetical protein
MVEIVELIDSVILNHQDETFLANTRKKVN